MSITVVGISGSPSAQGSKSRVLLEHALEQLRLHQAQATLIDLAALPADGLLGRRDDAAVRHALESVLGADIIVASTPVYRAAYTGLLKAFFDLLPQNALVGKVGVPIATGKGSAHALVGDHLFRPLFASVGAVVVSAALYGTDAQFRDGVPDQALLDGVGRAVREAVVLAAALAAGRAG